MSSVQLKRVSSPLTAIWPLLVSPVSSLPLFLVLVLIMFHGVGRSSGISLVATLTDTADLVPTAYLIALLVTAPLAFISWRRGTRGQSPLSFLACTSIVSLSGLLLFLAFLLPSFVTHRAGEHLLPVSVALFAWFLVSAPVIAATFRLFSAKSARGTA